MIEATWHSIDLLDAPTAKPARTARTSSTTEKAQDMSAAKKLKCNYWPGRGLMEVPRFCLAIAGKEYEDWRCTEGTAGMGNALDANLGRLPTFDCAEGTIGQSAAINYYVASECGLMGSTTFEAAKIIEFSEHVKELNSAFRALVPWGSEPKEEAMTTFFDSDEATDYEGPADGSKREARRQRWLRSGRQAQPGGRAPV